MSRSSVILFRERNSMLFSLVEIDSLYTLWRFFLHKDYASAEIGVHPKRPHTKTATIKTDTNENGHRLKRPQSDTKTLGHMNVWNSRSECMQLQNVEWKLNEITEYSYAVVLVWNSVLSTIRSSHLKYFPKAS